MTWSTRCKKCPWQICHGHFLFERATVSRDADADMAAGDEQIVNEAAAMIDAAVAKYVNA
jgi:hypothetical protein